MSVNLSAGQWITLALLVVILVLAAAVLVWLSRRPVPGAQPDPP